MKALIPDDPFLATIAAASAIVAVMIVLLAAAPGKPGDMHGRQLVTWLGMAASPSSRGPLPPLAPGPVPHRPAALHVAVHRQMPRRPAPLPPGLSSGQVQPAWGDCWPCGGTRPRLNAARTAPPASHEGGAGRPAAPARAAGTPSSPAGTGPVVNLARGPRVTLAC